MFTSALELLYMDKPNRSQKVMLKVVNVCVHNGNQTLKTCCPRWWCRSIYYPTWCCPTLDLTTQKLETILLRTVRQQIMQLNEASVCFEISPAEQLNQKSNISGAFTADSLGLSEHTHILWNSDRNSFTISRTFHYRPLTMQAPLYWLAQIMPI